MGSRAWGQQSHTLQECVLSAKSVGSETPRGVFGKAPGDRTDVSVLLVVS